MTRRLALCALAICLGAPIRTEADTGSYQAATWDKEITLPTGDYRAAKPVELNGDFTVKTQANTLVDGVSFLARGGVQHWDVEGTQFRRVHLTVKRNGSGHGVDSVFEDFDFNKDDSWYNFWWSTRWQFENCIFTKKLLRADLPPVDYAVKASRCTFYGVKLPTVGLKDNPAGYLGKGDLGFEKCRFVDCDVPQTFLAATVDCVFEGCRFEPKAKLLWPKETGAIKVHAYYGGDGSEPASFINGPLTVTFEAAPRGGEFGSTLPHEFSAGRVTLKNQRASGQFTALGTLPGKASEIVDVPADGGGPAGPGSTPNVFGVNPRAPAVAAVSVVHGLEEMLRALPARLDLRVGGQPSAPGVETANAILTKTFVGHPVSMRITPAGVVATNAPGAAYQATGRWQDVSYHDATIQACAVALFPAANAAALAKAPSKSEFPLGGIVSKAEIVVRRDAMSFIVTVAEARVQDPLVVLHPAAPPTPAVSEEAQMVGVWTILVQIDGNHWDQTFNADHSALADGKRIGSWEVKDNHFAVHMDGGGTDSYELPGKDGILFGTNASGWRLRLVRPGSPTPPQVAAQLVGQWKFEDQGNSSAQAVFSLNADHTFTEAGKLKGHWNTLGNTVVFQWEEHADWHDMFEWPETGGVLTGTNGSRHVVTLTRAGGAPLPKPAQGEPASTYFGSKSGVR